MISRAPVALPSYTEEVVHGLTSRPKTLPCKLLYDDRGSQLFEEITRLPEYYLTRTELGILQDYARNIVQAAGSPVSIVELGAGTATKTGTLLRAFARRQMRVKYFPVDISSGALGDAKERIKEECAKVIIHPVVADFGDGFHFLREIPGRKVVLYLGSSIGNFEWNDATAMLRRVRDQLTDGDALLLGTDMVKAPEILVPAYDDAQGVTEEFSKNILVRLNRELDANFDLDSFRHIAEWSPSQSRMEIFLQSLWPQTATLRTPRLTIQFRQGERIHTENSHKYTLEMIERMLCVSGFKLENTWFDAQKWFALNLARVQAD
ncbi:MAG: dimethylhistidine N-methyltransferase [Acidobacteria bacterium 13_1_20CM_4_56_7]|nr:MAG: dimethylhistidine N-methyltransferase [Acidobacteria bacterium 13_1_20CM_4_56_7]